MKSLNAGLTRRTEDSKQSSVAHVDQAGHELAWADGFVWVVLLVESIWTRSQNTTHLFWYVPQTILRIVDSDLWQSDADRGNDPPRTVVLFRGGPEPISSRTQLGHSCTNPTP
jgi:hypothetical protein